MLHLDILEILTENKGMVIDGILILVLLLTAIRGYKDGFLSAAINLAGNLGSLFAGRYVAKNYAQVFFEKVLRSGLIERSYNYLSQNRRSTDISEALASVLDNLPQSFVEKVVSAAQNAAQGVLAPTQDSAAVLVDDFIAPMLLPVIAAGLFVITFLVVGILCKILAKRLKIVNEVPLIGTANKIAGFLMGTASGVVNIILLSFLLYIICIVTKDGMSFVTLDILRQSKIIGMMNIANRIL